MDDLVKRIKKLALANNITIAELERATGISNGRIAKWENSIPGIDKVNLIAKFFDVSLDYLINGKEYVLNNISTVVQNNNAETVIVKNNGSILRELSKQEEEILKIYNELDLRKQTIFLSKIFEIENELNK